MVFYAKKQKKGGDTLIDYSPQETMKKRQISQYALINKGIDKHTSISSEKSEYHNPYRWKTVQYS